MLKECLNCGNFRLFYIKGIGKFEKENHGKCLAYNKIMQSSECCGQWKNNAVIRKTRRFVCYDIVDGLKYDLSEIMQILNEEREENKANPL